jgi:hypothetical protein
MNIAHQPGSEPLEIPEQIPNPVVRPVTPPNPEPRPDRKEPVKVPEKAPVNRVPAAGIVSLGDHVEVLALSPIGNLMRGGEIKSEADNGAAAYTGADPRSRPSSSPRWLA